jgi:hypothetical protein
MTRDNIFTGPPEWCEKARSRPVIKSSPVNAITSNVPRPGEYRFGPRKSNIHLKGGDTRVFLSGSCPISAAVAGEALCKYNAVKNEAFHIIT